MWTLTICFGDSAKEWKFGFKTRDRVDDFKRTLAGVKAGGTMMLKEVIIQDDFGQDAGIHIDSIKAWTIEDLDLQAEANNQIALAHARGHAKLESLVQADPDPDLKRAVTNMRRAATMNNFGPGNLGPMPGR